MLIIIITIRHIKKNVELVCKLFTIDCRKTLFENNETVSRKLKMYFNFERR